MSDTFITVVGIMLAVILLFVTPVIVTSQRVDDMSQLDVETLTSNFVDEIRVAGKLTLEKYNQFIEKLTSTGNIYDVDIEIKIWDENPGKKSLQTTTTKIGENIYYSLYTTQIIDRLNTEKEFNLRNGDIISVTVRNTNKTIGQKLKDLTFKIVGNNNYTINTTKSGLVFANGDAESVF